MHVKGVRIEGFKVYKDRIVLDPLSPRHNCIVGANGSGKSNFFAAIQFVLDTLQGQLRTEERKALLHEGAGAHVMSAYVEITLDNADRRMPTDRDEVVIKRAIGLKKDEYFIDRKHATKTEVTSLLETAGLSRANPYNIVPQGRVNALTTMKDEQRLHMLMELAGCNIYDERRAESQAILSQTDDRQGKIRDMLKYIEQRLKELNSEKEELVQYQMLDKRRKIAEYTYYDKELRKAKAELEKMDAKQSEDARSAKEAAQAEDAINREIAEAERGLKTLAADISLRHAEYRSHTSDKKKLLETIARLEMNVKQRDLDKKRGSELEETTTRELAEVDEQISKVEARLQSSAPDVAAKAAEKERCSAEVERVEATLQQLHSKASRTTQFTSKQARDKHLSKEAAELKASIKKKDTQAAALQAELDAAKSKMSEAEKALAERRKLVAAKRSEAEVARTRCSELRGERDRATDERKALWRKEQELHAARKTAADDLERAQRTLQHSMARSQWEAVSAVRRIVDQKRIKGVHGMLIELLTTDEKFNTAIDVAAGNQLFQMVVDTDDTAATVLRELQKANAGRVTFMPLNRLRVEPDPAYPDDCLPMMSKKVLKFDDRYRPAFAQVFRKSLLVRDLNVGARISKEHSLDCITLDGDQCNRKGAMTGGFIETRRSRVGAQAEIVRLSKELARLDQEMEQAASALQEVDERVTSLLSDLHRFELAAQKAVAAAELESIDLPTGSGSGGGSSKEAHRAAGAQKERAHSALLAAAQSDRDRLAAIEAEMQTEFDSKLSAKEHAEIKRLHESKRELERQRDAAMSESARAEADASNLRSSLSEHLRPRQEELQQTLARLADDADREGGAEGSDSAHLEEARNRLAATEEALQAAAAEREEKREQERSLQANVERLKNHAATERAKHAEEAKALDRMLSRRGLLQEKEEEFTSCIRKLGSLPKDAFEHQTAQSSKQLVAEIERCHQELSKLTHVNKKALDQFQSFSEQRDRLVEKQAELDEARASITELIDHLDHKKDEAIERTFKGVSDKFRKTFTELVGREGSGKLIMSMREQLPSGTDAKTKVANYVGVSIRVKFPGQGDATSMNQLSGGQKTMVALCLIFAIQRCDPAPFYIFDEIDAALDATHRAALAAMIERQAAEVDADGKDQAPTQFITTTFRPELIRAADKCFGVTHANKASSIKPIEQEEALRIIAEDQNRQRQHAGIGMDEQIERAAGACAEEARVLYGQAAVSSRVNEARSTSSQTYAILLEKTRQL